MSSMRNAVQRRSYRERGQIREREKLGLLEKHKDYALRAKDHTKKQKILKSLKQKAAERNEDEFYFGMLSRGKFSANRLSGGKKWTGTVAGDRGNKSMDVDTVRLLKTQDMGYLRTMRNVAAKEVRELEQKAVITRAFSEMDAKQDDDDSDRVDSGNEDAPRKKKPGVQPKKIVFVDSAEEVAKILSLQEDEEMGTDKDDGLETPDKENDVLAFKRPTNAELLRRKLRSAKRKLRTLTDAETALEMQRARMAKTATVGGITKSGKKWKIRERKR